MGQCPQEPVLPNTPMVSVLTARFYLDGLLISAELFANFENLAKLEKTVP